MSIVISGLGTLLQRSGWVVSAGLFAFARGAGIRAHCSDLTLREIEPESVWIIPVGVQGKDVLQPLFPEKPFGIGLHLHQETVVTLRPCGCASGG